MRKADTKITKFLSGAALVVALFAFSGDALAQSTRELSNRLSRLENEVETLSRGIYKGGTPPAGATSSGGAAASGDTEIRLQQLEMQIQQLTGKVEEQAFETRQLKEAMERLQGDLDMRLGDLERGGGASSAGAIGGGAAGASSSSGSAGSVGFSNESTGSEASSSSGSTDVPSPEPRSGRPGDVTLYNGGSASGGTTQNLAGSGDASSAYENAFSMLKSGNYDKAERGFDEFLKKNPDHALAGNAQYWLGETYYVRGDFERAARIFAEGYQKYPQGSKTPDNLLKLGLSLSSIGKKDDACIALRQLQKDYSTGSGAVLRRGEQEMSRLGC